LIGGSGDDTLAGGAGNDTYGIDSLSDVIQESSGGGLDTIETNLSGVSVTSFGTGVENLRSSGYYGGTPVVLTGSGGANVVGFKYDFTSGAGVFDGLGGNDTLTGAAGNDTLKGGLGNDALQGNDGADRLIGGRGADRFVFGTDYGSATDSPVDVTRRDVITDFGLGADRIDLRRIDPNHSASGSGDQAFEFIGHAQFTGNLTDGAGRGEVRFVLLDKAGTANDRTFVFGAMHGDTVATFAVTLIGLHDLTANDFLL
jgi:Ca2+-binding RTX toxin-like protein